MVRQSPDAARCQLSWVLLCQAPCHPSPPCAMALQGSGKAEDNHVERADVLDRVEGFLAKLSMGGAAQP